MKLIAAETPRKKFAMRTIEDSLKELEGLLHGGRELRLPDLDHRYTIMSYENYEQRGADVSRQQICQTSRQRENAYKVVPVTYTTHLVDINSDFITNYKLSAPTQGLTTNDRTNPTVDVLTESKANYQYYNKPTKLKASVKRKKSLAIVPAWVNVPEFSRFFVIKSISLDHIKKSFYNSIWSSTHFGNRKLSQAYKELKAGAKIFLFFSVNASGRFCGVAEMSSDLQDCLDTSLWDDSSKYGSAFRVRWVLVKDLKNAHLKRFLIPENEMKPITKSRDTQEIPFYIGQAVLQLFKSDNTNIKCFLDQDYN